MITILTGDALQQLKTISSRSVNCCVTSPPYFGLRDYGVDGQIGLEKTPDEYVAALVEVFREVKRVLRDDGTLWLNLGDSYAGGGGASGHTSETKNLGAKTANYGAVKTGGRTYGLKPKDLIGIPWRVAFALQADGWYLRQDIIWHKSNPMPESVTDRCTKSHEYIFLLSKSARYYYDAEAIAEPVSPATISRFSQDVESQTGSDRVPGKDNGNMKAVAPRFGGAKYGNNDDGHYNTYSGNLYEIKNGKRNKRSVWTVATKPYSQAHFATYPPDLIIPCIKAGCPEGGTVLDPFAGSGTTMEVAARLGRNSVGIEINPEYVNLIEQRCHEWIYGQDLFALKESVNYE